MNVTSKHYTLETSVHMRNFLWGQHFDSNFHALMKSNPKKFKRRTHCDLLMVVGQIWLCWVPFSLSIVVVSEKALPFPFSNSFTPAWFSVALSLYDHSLVISCSNKLGIPTSSATKLNTRQNVNLHWQCVGRVLQLPPYFLGDKNYCKSSMRVFGCNPIRWSMEISWLIIKINFKSWIDFKMKVITIKLKDPNGFCAFVDLPM